MSDDPPESSTEGSRSRGWNKLRGKIMEKDYKFSFKRHHDSATNVSDEVDDFLGKTTSNTSDSVDRPSVPKINTASNEVPAWATRPEDLQEGKWRPTKPNRRPGLSVGFRDVPPTIIGEGGDEAEDAVSTIRHHAHDTSPQSYVRSSSATAGSAALHRQATTARHIQDTSQLPGPVPSAHQQFPRPPPPELVYPRQPTLPNLSPASTNAKGSTDDAHSTREPLTQARQTTVPSPAQPRQAQAQHVLSTSFDQSRETRPPQNYLQVASGFGRLRSDSDNSLRSPSSPSAQKIFEMHAAEGMAHRNSIRSLHEDVRAALRSGSPSSSVSSLENAGQMIANRDGVASAESSRPTSTHSRHSVSPEPAAVPATGHPNHYPMSAPRSQKYLSPPGSAKGLFPTTALGDLSQYSQNVSPYVDKSEAAVLRDVAPLPYRPLPSTANTAAAPSSLLVNRDVDPPALVASATTTTGPVAPTPRRPSNRQGLHLVDDTRREAPDQVHGTSAIHGPEQYPKPAHSTGGRADGAYASYNLTDLNNASEIPPPQVDAHEAPQMAQNDIATGRLAIRSSLDDNESMSYFAGFATGASSILSLSAASDGRNHSLQDWQCCALWWFLKARTSLEAFAREAGPRSPRLSEPDAGTLRQCHLDLAKAWWIDQAVLPDQIARIDSASQADDARTLHESLMISFNSLLVSMRKRNILPPPQYGLVQGVDTSIWTNDPFDTYPSEWAWILNGSSFAPSGRTPSRSPLHSLPLGDDGQTYCYGRVFGRAAVAGSDENPSHRPFDCALTVLRKKQSPELELTIASQTLAGVVMLRTDDEAGVHWEHARFDHEIHCLRVKLPHKLRLWVYCSPKDYAWLWSCYDNSQKITRSMRPHSDEISMPSFPLASFQYRDSARPDEFPVDRIESCRAALFERLHSPEDRARRRTHRGYRLAIMTTGKIIRNVTFVVGTKAPLQYAVGSSAPEFRLQLNELDRGRSAHLVFHNYQQRDQFRDLITGIAMKVNEQVLYKLPLKHVAAGAVVQGMSPAQWPSLRFTALQIIDDTDPDDPHHLYSSVDMAENLRLMMFNKEGSVVDRLCDASMEVRIRMEAQQPNRLQVMRPAPREDLTVSIGPGTGSENSLRHTFDTATSVPSALNYEFEQLTDMHTFERALTGYRVIYDGIASLFTITRRRMYVGKDKNWDAKGPRLQIVEREGRYQVLAFFEDYVVADCLNFEVKRTDTFEQVVGSKTAGSGIHGIKMVDAKFTLPGSNKDDWLKEGAQRDAGARYTTLATEEYAAEHDDILVHFDREEERDKFGDALPAPVTKARKFTLMRRI